MHHLQLKPVNPLSECVTLCDYQGIPVLYVQHALAEAAISLHGGHLIAYKPTGENDVIWLSEKAEFATDKAIRGGIPVCWPWFGKVTSPSHGFARNSMWSLQEHRENDTGVVVALTLEDTEQTLAIWPHKFLTQIVFEIGSELKVSLNVTNTDEHDWSFTGALHTYFTVDDIHQTQVTGMGPSYNDSLQGGTQCTGGDILTFNGETDRVYTQPTDVITIKDGQRQLDIANTGDNSAVIWNPWQDLSINMGDMADNSFETMLCVESTIQGEAINLAPGATHTLTTTVRVRK
uniref:D-hexose-6-phosphate mutarotase n=1 Tax=Thaumasiovibrio occultus TaxID=1891184 RepID=UPI000B36070D|nr:D-hexose-6-phosphate mutarotase [Thaumasiovibrio occultus]